MHYCSFFFPGIGLIASGAYDVVVAGGVETMSDVPIRLNRGLRAMLLKMNKAKTPLQKLRLLSTFSPRYLAPEVSHMPLSVLQLVNQQTLN